MWICVCVRPRVPCFCVVFHVSCSPMTMFNRHNEVWFVAEDEPVCEEKSSEETD